MKKISCAEARKIDLVDFLATLGFEPKNVSRQDFWYNSPFREETTPSFKINRDKNVWFDFGEGTGGDLINFGTRYFNCSVSELLERLRSQLPTQHLSFHPRPGLPGKVAQPSLLVAYPAGEKKEPSDGKILVLDDRPLSSNSLLDYLNQRKIPVAVAEHFCREVDYLLYNKTYAAIGFKNDAGGFELRRPNFKAGSSPKAITFFDNLQQRLAVFEGFFNFLSYQTIQQIRSKSLVALPDRQSNFLVLNSLSFFQKAREKMEQHEQVHLFLDNDKAGIKWRDEALKWSAKYIDKSIVYKDFKDLNEFLIKYREQEQRQSPRQGKHF